MSPPEREPVAIPVDRIPPGGLNAPQLTGPYTTIVVTLRAGDRRVRFSMTPEELSIGDEGRDSSLSGLDDDFELRTGRGLSTYSWSGMLPGRGRRAAAYVNEDHWQPPEDIRDLLREWTREKHVVRFDVSGARISNDVRVASFESRHSGGLGDIFYSITLREHRDLEVSRHGRKKKGKRKRKGSPDGKKGEDRGGDGRHKTYTVKAGDTLQKIARRFLGSASKWRDIYEANRKKIGPNPDDLKVGLVLTIPNA